MKNWKSTISLIFALVGSGWVAGSMIGCTVDVGTVRSRPPVIPATVQTALESQEFGTMNFKDELDMDGISFFLWPEGISGAALEEKVYNVNLTSMAIDGEFENLRKGVRSEEAFFRTRNCAKYAANEGAALGGEVVWREVDANASEADKTALVECKTSKEKYGELTSGGYAKIASLKEKILSEVGPENWREVNKKTSMISIKADGPSAVAVAITLKVGKVVYSNLPEKVSGKPAQLIEGAEYIVPRRLLRFRFNDLDEKRQPTGLVYQVDLERAGDYLTGAYEPMARFTGDVRLVNADGKVVRNGSFQMISEMAEDSVE